jgi:hypothetical protein
MQVVLAGELAIVLGYVYRTGARPWLTWGCIRRWPRGPHDARTVQCADRRAGGTRNTGMDSSVEPAHAAILVHHASALGGC